MTTNGESALASNIKRIGHLDLEGGGQVVVQGNYAYVGHMEPPLGTSSRPTRFSSATPSAMPYAHWTFGTKLAKKKAGSSWSPPFA